MKLFWVVEVELHAFLIRGVLSRWFNAAKIKSNTQTENNNNKKKKKKHKTIILLLFSMLMHI
jgi:hypothetical protein